MGSTDEISAPVKTFMSVHIASHMASEKGGGRIPRTRPYSKPSKTDQTRVSQATVRRITQIRPVEHGAVFPA